MCKNTCKTLFPFILMTSSPFPPLPPLCPGISLAADSSDTQLTWLNALEGAGIEILPEADEMEDALKKATSIFDFEARSIDGELVKLNKYESVVNVCVCFVCMCVCMEW